MAISIFDQVIEEKFCGMLHRLIAFSKEIHIACVVVVIPQMQTQPSTAHWPQAPEHTINGHRMSPKVSVVMHNKSTGTVQVLSYVFTISDCVFDQVVKRFVKFREIADLGGPVIHLCVDVDCVLTIPGRF
jgi:hypothetical protein